MRFQPSPCFNTPEERDEFYRFIKSEYNDGKTTIEIGKDVGLSDHTIGKHLKRCGVTMRVSNAVRGHTEKMIVAMYKKGFTYKKIYQTVGVSKHCVPSTLKRLGLYKPPKRIIKCRVKSCKDKVECNGFCMRHRKRFDIVKLSLAKGMTREEIYKKHPSIKPYFVTKFFPKNKKHKFSKMFISTIYDCGVPTSQIAKYYKTHFTNITNFMKNNGIELRPRGGPNRLLWKGKKIPCKVCGERYAHTKGMCQVCYNRQLHLKHKRQRIFEQMLDEHTTHV